MDYCPSCGKGWPLHRLEQAEHHLVLRSGAEYCRDLPATPKWARDDLEDMVGDEMGRMQQDFIDRHGWDPFADGIQLGGLRHPRLHLRDADRAGKAQCTSCTDGYARIHSYCSSKGFIHTSGRWTHCDGCTYGVPMTERLEEEKLLAMLSRTN